MYLRFDYIRVDHALHLEILNSSYLVRLATHQILANALHIRSSVLARAGLQGYRCHLNPEYNCILASTLSGKTGNSKSSDSGKSK